MPRPGPERWTGSLDGDCAHSVQEQVTSEPCLEGCEVRWLRRQLRGSQGTEVSAVGAAEGAGMQGLRPTSGHCCLQAREEEASCTSSKTAEPGEEPSGRSPSSPEQGLKLESLQMGALGVCGRGLRGEWGRALRSV